MKETIKEIDKKIQGVVDSAVIWLMRRGIPKSLTVYGVASFLVAAFMTRSVMKGDGPFMITFNAFCAALTIIVIEYNRRQDEAAEGRNVMSTAEPSREIIKSPLWKAFMVVGFTMFPWGQKTQVLAIFCAVQWGVGFIECYVLAAPRTPPPERKTVPANLVFQGVK